MSASIQSVDADQRSGAAYWRERFRAVRALTLQLSAPLSAEDQVIQSMPDVSPTKWHLAHTTWFFEEFLLRPHARDYAPLDDKYGYLFNSYYEAVGPRHPRPARGMISRPSLDEVHAYRAHIDAAMEALLDGPLSAEIASALELGLHHEQQHQELILMDIKHVLSVNPLRPSYGAKLCAGAAAAPALDWVRFPGGLNMIGHDGAGFAYDNEGPQHREWMAPFKLATRLVTSGEYRDFIEDGGYARPEFWLSDGWATVQAEGWAAPLYWEGDTLFTLAGVKPITADTPVCHISYYEADAYARWAGRRLPRENEWEIAARTVACEGHDAVSGEFHPRPAQGEGLMQMFGDVWEWTQSSYTAYPGFKPAAGAIGEYNGKFMCAQFVLRGGAAVTPPGHIRPTYRNFFPPGARWAFSGVRLADDDA